MGVSPSKRGSSVSASISLPAATYSRLGISPLKKMVSVSCTFSSALAILSSVSESFAFVPISGNEICCSVSFKSVWAASFFPSWWSSSKITVVFPAKEVASNVKVTSALPDDFFAVNSFSAVTGFSSIRIASPVSASISVPIIWYFWPFFNPEYSTVSISVTFFSGLLIWVPVFLSRAVVQISILSSVSVPKSTLTESL